MSGPAAGPEDPGSAAVTPLIDRPDVVHVYVHGLGAMPNPDALERELGRIDLYAERALLCARPRDVVCVPEPIDPAYLTYLRRTKIGPRPENILVLTGGPDRGLAQRLAEDTAALRRIAERVAGGGGRLVLNPFIGTPSAFALGAALEQAVGAPVRVLGGNAEAVLRAGHKNVAREWARRLGVPVAPGEAVELETRPDGRPADLGPLRRAVERRLPRTGRVIVRGAVGASGTSTVVVEDERHSLDRALSILAERTNNSVYLVEAMLPIAESPNLQAFVDPDDGAVRLASVADQRLDQDLLYDGNIWPSRARWLGDMARDVRRLAGRLGEEGFTGLMGCDFVEFDDPDGGGRDYVMAELNPRTNASLYAKALAERVGRREGGVGAWLSAGVRTGAGSFAEFRDRHGERFYRPGQRRGVFPYNTGCLRKGELSVVYLGGSREEVVRMYEEFKERLRERR